MEEGSHASPGGAEGVRSVRSGVRPQGQRDHNERLILSTLQRAGPLPGSDLARLAGLSPQAVSVILRRLEGEGLVRRGEPVRGRVGKPRVPVGLDPDGVLSLGLKLGRRSSDLLLADFAGQVRGQVQFTYRWPVPEAILRFVQDGIAALTAGLPPAQVGRIAGVGVAQPFQIWIWHEALGATPEALSEWRDLDLAAEVGRATGLPVFVENDGTAACRAEHVFGRGREFRDFAYLFVGSFVGGGVVLDHSVFEGSSRNAGALGSLPARAPDGSERQLLDTASLYLLEDALGRHGIPTARMWAMPQDWSGFGAPLDAWVAATSAQLARAAATICAVIDFEAVLIDGAVPAEVRARLVEGARAELGLLDTRGLAPIRIEAGRVGGNARALGAATGPVFARHLLNTHGSVGG
jgi:predicted NBD/HSP70 family sugar kinase